MQYAVTEGKRQGRKERSKNTKPNGVDSIEQVMVVVVAI
jgi:hypothetical protein